MAELDDEKTLDPTAHRRQQAREQGQVARSQDVGSAILLLGSCGVLMWLGRPLVDFLGHLMVRQLGGEPWLAADIPFVVRSWHETVNSLGVALLPLLGLMMVLAVVGNVIQVGWLFLPTKAMPDFSRVDPVAGVGRLFSLANLTRLGFGLLKMVVVASVAWFSLAAEKDKALNCGQLPLPELAVFISEMVIGTVLKIGVALVALAGLDYAYQRLRHERDLRMSPQELRAEMRNLQGDPQTAGRRRALWRQFGKNDSLAAVQAASLVVRNSAGQVVALRFNARTGDAPVVAAKGDGSRGKNLLALAARHRVPTSEREALARDLFAATEPEQPIPSHLYAPVASLLVDAKRPRAT
jgi:flagellar biosynthetic protein FlhB